MTIKKQHHTTRYQSIVLFGYPGSGKSTQAEMVAIKYGMYHFNTGRFVENLVHDADLAHHPDIKRERILFDTGKIMDSDFILAHVGARIEELAANGEKIIFSGSPRTQAEAFGTKKHQKGFIDILEKAYGKKNILYVLLKVTPGESLKRNSKRFMCSVCQMPILGVAHEKHLTSCPFCGGKLYRRKLDTPETIKVRFQEYDEKTKPIIETLTKRGVVVHTISAQAMPYRVFKRIISLLV